jgi:hypothetical protein
MRNGVAAAGVEADSPSSASADLIASGGPSPDVHFLTNIWPDEYLAL